LWREQHIAASYRSRVNPCRITALTLAIWLRKVFTSNQMHHCCFTSCKAKTYNASCPKSPYENDPWLQHWKLLGILVFSEHRSWLVMRIWEGNDIVSIYTVQYCIIVTRVQSFQIYLMNKMMSQRKTHSPPRVTLSCKNRPWYISRSIFTGGNCSFCHSEQQQNATPLEIIFLNLSINMVICTDIEQ